jgi:hypothetical protein
MACKRALLLLATLLAAANLPAALGAYNWWNATRNVDSYANASLDIAEIQARASVAMCGVIRQRRRRKEYLHKNPGCHAPFVLLQALAAAGSYAEANSIYLNGKNAFRNVAAGTLRTAYSFATAA